MAICIFIIANLYILSNNQKYMNITKCDICNKTIDNDSEVCIGYLSPLPRYSLCLNCAKPVVDLLKKHKLIAKDKKK